MLAIFLELKSYYVSFRRGWRMKDREFENWRQAQGSAGTFINPSSDNAPIPPIRVQRPGGPRIATGDACTWVVGSKINSCITGF